MTIKLNTKVTTYNNDTPAQEIKLQIITKTKYKNGYSKTSNTLL